MNNNRSALVVGATGLVGSELIKILCNSEEYKRVRVIVRRTISYSHPKLEELVRDFDHLIEEDIGGVQDVFCCLGTTIKKAGSREAFKKVDFDYVCSIAHLAKKQGAEHFIVITAMGANEKSLFNYSRIKGMVEKELKAMDFKRLSIVRPSLLTGERNEARFLEGIGSKVSKVIDPLLGKKYRSISGEQVAIAMKSIALKENAQKVVIYPSEKLQEF